MAILKIVNVEKGVNMTKILNKSIVLGSSSPRRRDVLSLYDIDFTIDHADIDERDISTDITPEEYTKTLALRKGAVLIKRHPESVVISADTIVHLNGEYLCKPQGRDDAIKMLKKLSGKTHVVGSAIAIHEGAHAFAEYDETLVSMRELSDNQIQRYIDAYSPMDKAGAYGIQDGGGILIQKIEGNFHNVLGFEVKTLEKLFAKIGLDLWDYLIKK